MDPPPPPPGSYGVEPFCRLFVEGALCNATQGLLVAGPSLEVNILCSQFTLTGIPASCLTVQGRSEHESCAHAAVARAWLFLNGFKAICDDVPLHSLKDCNAGLGRSPQDTHVPGPAKLVRFWEGGWVVTGAGRPA